MAWEKIIGNQLIAKGL